MSPGILVLVMIGQIGSTVVSVDRWKLLQDDYSHARGNCQDCRPGEAMAQTEMRIPPGVYVDIDAPPCGDPHFRGIEVPDDLKRAIASAYYGQAGRTPGVFALSFSDKAINLLVRAGSNDAGEVGRFVRSSTAQPQVASCVRLVVAIPKAATITRVVPTLSCPAGGWCGFEGEPTTTELDAQLVAVTAVAKNWSHNRDAIARLQVFYSR